MDMNEFAFLTLNKGKSTIIFFVLLWACSIWGSKNTCRNLLRLLFTGTETFEVKRLIEIDGLADELAFYLRHQANSTMEALQLPYKMDKYGTFCGFHVHTSIV